MDFNFMDFVIGMAVGLFVAYSIVKLVGRLLYHKLVAEGVIKSVEEEEAQSQRIEMMVEQHGDILYAFRKDTDDFVCQGANFEELRANFSKRFPNYNGSVEGLEKELHERLLAQKNELTKSA